MRGSVFEVCEAVGAVYLYKQDEIGWEVGGLIWACLGSGVLAGRAS